ncbi:MAG: hypothetical protein HRT47_05875 [Candidatus Caenarcaniphilales bacterium]|nr:hypothetical protein [Candidatus Caenarcaniphilales bacterium]
MNLSLSPQIINQGSKRDIEPVDMPGSTHPSTYTIQDLKVKVEKTNKRSHLQGLHANRVPQELEQGEESKQTWLQKIKGKVSTLAQKISPANWPFIKAPKLFILVPHTKIDANNKYKIPSGNYIILNKARRLPARVAINPEGVNFKENQGFNYEFPGRTFGQNAKEILENPDKALPRLMQDELGISEENQGEVTVGTLAKNYSPDAGMSTKLNNYFSGDIPETAINSLIDNYPTTYDPKSKSYFIEREADGGIQAGIVLVKEEDVGDFLDMQSQNMNTISDTTEAGLNLLRRKRNIS